MEERIRINRSVYIALDFDENLHQDTISAATVIVIVITAALMQKEIKIDKVVLDSIDADRMKVIFYGQPGSFQREYIFDTAMLLKAVEKAKRNHPVDSLQNQLIKEIEHAYNPSN